MRSLRTSRIRACTGGLARRSRLAGRGRHRAAGADDLRNPCERNPARHPATSSARRALVLPVIRGVVFAATRVTSWVRGPASWVRGPARGGFPEPSRRTRSTEGRLQATSARSVILASSRGPAAQGRSPPPLPGVTGVTPLPGVMGVTGVTPSRRHGPPITAGRSVRLAPAGFPGSRIRSGARIHMACPECVIPAASALAASASRGLRTAQARIPPLGTPPAVSPRHLAVAVSPRHQVPAAFRRHLVPAAFRRTGTRAGSARLGKQAGSARLVSPAPSPHRATAEDSVRSRTARSRTARSRTTARFRTDPPRTAARSVRWEASRGRTERCQTGGELARVRWRTSLAVR
jgi:hypothetical protein